MSIVGNLRLRYVFGLSAIAILMTTSFFTMQHLISKQRDFSQLINLAGHQSGLTNRIAYFASLMAATDDETEFNQARSQVGLTINKMQAAHKALRDGDRETRIPQVTNDALEIIYKDPMMGLDSALERFLERARNVYETDLDSLSTGSIDYIYLVNYGPHVLEPLLDAAVDEYEHIGRASIVKIERFELIIWLAALAALLLEALFIFRPLEKQVCQALNSLQASVTKLTSTQQRLVEAQRLALVGDWEMDVATGALSCSEQVYEIVGRPMGTVEMNGKNVLEFIHPDDKNLVKNQFNALSRNPEALNMEFRVIRPDGSERLVYQQAASVKGEDGDMAKISATIHDITERKELSNRLDKLSRHIPGFIFQYKRDRNENECMPYVSPGVQQTWGVNTDVLKDDARVLSDLVYEEDLQKLLSSIDDSALSLKTWKAQFRIRHPEKGEIWLEGHATPERMMDGGTLWYGYIWDITERRQAENRIRKLALYDALTGLANRRMLMDRLAHAVALSCREKNYGAVLMLDLDNFKSLNDTRGHDTGDALLVEVGKRLTGCVRKTDTVARLGGDEFVVLLECLGSDEKIGIEKTMAVAEKIRSELNKPYILGDARHIHHTSASVGVAIFNGRDRDESEVLKHADVAMYEAKDLGRNRVCFYSKARQVIVDTRSAMALDMKNGLDNGEFCLYLQPQVSKKGALCGAEALLRWLPRDKPPVSPGSFIPVAESTGLILPLGEWVLKQACTIVMELEKCQLPENFALAVNISAMQFAQENFIDKVRRVFDETGATPLRLKFELTETCLVQDIKRAGNIMKELRNMGLQVELDDFGTGYSSLNSIKNLPLTALKIDASLIRGIEKDEPSRAIVRAALAMARAMSLQTIAEGVETHSQMDYLVSEKCDMIQGYLFAKPMPYEDFLFYLDRKVKTA
ncbi:EAL domain-containing protein [uncultured Desulfobacter sp.]|uniref:EAL domain-containing protein n=1 Tax=uncultured Desulfobacter sp. TaxID=240139 RepID=UPI002AAAF758|nr:EAL domain-containing protein [uncultured Desulfobacter sp.]